MNRARWALKQVLNTLGYSLARKAGPPGCPALPRPSPETVARAADYFSTSFPIAAGGGLAESEVAAAAKKFFWHYPFKFGGLLVDADDPRFRGLTGRHYQRYLHVFPPLLSLTGGSLEGKTVLEIGCNAGFWSIQARRAGARYVRGVDRSPKNVEQARFIADVIGMDGVEYGEMHACDVSRAALGEYDVTLFLGLLYHIAKPIEALERLYDVTRTWAVVDTTVARADVPDGVPVLKLEEDVVHEQNFSDGLALVPSKSAVPLMLKHVGFREVFWVPTASRNLPLDYLTGARMTYIAVR